MKVAIVGKLSDRKLFTKLQPLVNNESIEEITVFRYQPGLKQEKVNYITLHRRIPQALYPIACFFKFLSYQHSNNRKFDLIISFFLYPHGYVSYLCSKITGLMHVHCIIAGSREIVVFGNIIKFFSLLILNQCYNVIVMGKNSENEVIDLGVNPEIVKIIPNYIDTEKYYPSNEVKKYDIVVVTRYNHIKRIDRLIDIISEMSKRSYRLKTCLIGSGPLLAEIKMYSIEKGVNDLITFENEVHSEGVISYLNEGKYFVLTSDFEGIPHSLMEAMACGLCCIAPSVGDIGDLIESKVSGILVNKSVDEYCSAMIQLIGDKEYQKKISYNAVSRINNNFSVRIAEQYWNSVLNS